MNFELIGVVGAVGPFRGIFVELFEEIHYFDERMAGGNVFGVAVSVVTFAVDMDRLTNFFGGRPDMVVDESVVIGFESSFFHRGGKCL